MLVCSMHIEQLVPMVYVSAKCFLTGFDHKCSLPQSDFLLPLFNTVAHKGHAANKKLLQIKSTLLQIKNNCSRQKKYLLEIKAVAAN